MRRWIDIVAIAAFALPVGVFAQETKPAEQPKPAEAPAKTTEEKKPVAPVQKEDKKALEAKLEAKKAEMEDLKVKAGTVTKKLGEMTANGQVPTTPEGIQAMKEMVETLQEIQETLEKIQEEIEGIKGWIEGQNEALPIMSQDILDLKRHRWGNYIQVQYRDTDQVGGATDAFSLRRVRLGITQSIDSRTSLRASFDLATSTTNNVAQLRDAFVKWDLEPSAEKVGTEIQFGQFPMELGYELSRSSGERELPERATYNRVMFAGERSRGVQIKHGINPNSHIVVGGFNALTYDDPEQRSVAPGPGNRLGVLAGYRWYNQTMDFGISGFWGERNTVTTTRTVNNSTVTLVHPNVDREYIYIDGTIVGIFVPQLFLKFEIMDGKDRVPITPGANSGVTSVRDQVDLGGHQVQLGYNVNYRNQLNLRWDQWDPNRDIDGNVVTTWGVAWSYFINPGARLTLSQEYVEDPSRANLSDQKYKITTLRAIFRF